MCPVEEDRKANKLMTLLLMWLKAGIRLFLLTIDSLQKRLRDISVPVIYVRQKSRLEIDGIDINMFKLITLQDTIRIPPETFGNPLEKVGREQVKQKYEGIVDEELGYVIAVTGIQVSPIGKIIPGDGATYP